MTAAVQVTANPSPARAHSSPQIARDPRSGTLAVVESDPRSNTRSCKLYLSTTGGATWAPGGELMTKPFTDCAFYGEYGPMASVAYGRDGTLYVAFIASEILNRARDLTPRHFFLARSTDGGRTFTTTKAFDAPDGKPDIGLNKGPTLAVDPNDPENVYVGWRQGIRGASAVENLKTNVAASIDGGRTFGAPVNIADDRGGDYPWMTVGPDGTLHALYWTRTGTFPLLPAGQANPPRPIIYVRSTDQGKTWSPRQEIDPGNQRSGSPRPPVMAADPNSANLYVAWYSNAEAMNFAADFQGNLDIFFRRSTDGGKTWGDRVVLNDDKAPGGRPANQFDPGISVAPNGRVDVAWYDGRLSLLPPAMGTGNDENGFQDVFYTSSADAGATWSSNVRITDRSIDRRFGVWSNAGGGNHHTVGITSTNDAVFFAWQDTRNANELTHAEDIYFATLKPNGLELAVASKGDDGVPGWLLVGAGIAVGLGLAMVVVAAVGRRREPSVSAA